MRRACLPICCWPMSPSISSLGVSAATESMTITSIFPLRTRLSVISSACSPVSGCEISRELISTPTFFAYSGSSACSASIKAQIPPFFCASAITCKPTVVFPLDSGPKISTMRPRGRPPMPSAQSMPIEPVGMAFTSTFGCAPSIIIDSSPNFVFISLKARSMSLSVPAPVCLGGAFSFFGFMKGIIHVEMSVCFRNIDDIKRLYRFSSTRVARLEDDAVGAGRGEIGLFEFALFGHADGLPVEAQLGDALRPAADRGEFFVDRDGLVRDTDDWAGEEPLRFIERIACGEHEKDDERDADEA